MKNDKIITAAEIIRKSALGRKEFEREITEFFDELIDKVYEQLKKEGYLCD